MTEFVCKTEAQKVEAAEFILNSKNAVRVEVKRIVGKRTGQQNKAIHLFCKWLAQALNDAGLSVMQTLRHDAEIPWTEHLVKELIWRTVQIPATGKESTTQLNKLEVGDVYDIINRHMSENHGVGVRFPSESDMSEYRGW